ncbi:MAG: ferritin [Candidatus Latescibacteria bacterium]|nr:ferritin [Candidatus Latescibacterota bacterium]
MLTAKTQQALNDQLNAEFFSAYSYLAQSAFFEHMNLRGFSHWMRIQYQEELVHATKVFDFINERDGRVLLQPVAVPTTEWDSPLDAFEAALAGERKLSNRIYQLVELAMAERDYATHNFMQWFISEQVEEEALFHDVSRDLKLVGDDNNGLFLMDRDLAKRQLGADQEAADPAGAI